MLDKLFSSFALLVMFRPDLFVCVCGPPTQTSLHLRKEFSFQQLKYNKNFVFVDELVIVVLVVLVVLIVLLVLVVLVVSGVQYISAC